MPGTTVKYALPYPTPDDIPDGAAQIKALAEKLDTVIVAGDVGNMKFSARTAEHGNWIKADGRTLSAGQYTALRDVLIADGMPYGSASGNPKIPDMRGRLPIGVGAGPGLTTRAAGQMGGVERHALATSEMPSHRHDSDKGSTIVVDSAVGTGWALATSGARQVDGGNLTNVGGGATHENMPPFTAGQWFILAG